MVQMEATLQGDRYLGRFSATTEETRRWVGREYAERSAHFYNWQGMGIIEDTQTKEAHRFLFRTPAREGVSDSIGQLESEIVRIEGEWGRGRSPPIIEKGAIYDMVLQQMYRDAIAGEETEIIPNVFPKTLSYEELLSRSLVADEKSGQISLRLSI